MEGSIFGRMKRKRKSTEDDKVKKVLKTTNVDDNGDKLDRSAETVIISDREDSQPVMPSTSNTLKVMFPPREDESSSGDSNSSDSESMSSDTAEEETCETPVKMTTIKNTISKTLKVGEDGQTIYVVKLNCNDDKKRLTIPMEAVRKLVKREGKLRRKYHAMCNKYNDKHHIFKSYEMVLSKKPQTVKAGFRKLSNRWYMDLRHYEHKDYVKENGVCVPVEDAWKLINHLDKCVLKSWK